MRLLAASIGVAFAACLFWLPAAVYLGLRANASALVRHAGAELWLADANTEFLDQAIPFPRARASRIEADACAAHSEPLLITYTPYTTSNGGHDGLQLIGTSRASLPWSSVVGLPSDLVRPGAVAIDLADEPTRRVHGEPELEVGEHVLDVRVRTGGIRSVGLTPIAFASPTSARTALGMPATETHFVLIDVEDDACRAHLLSLASQVHGLRAFTSEELSLLSEDQLVTRSGVAVALAFVTLLGMLVAGVFVAQTLISTLEESRRDLAMLSALGASRGEIVTFTLVQANLVLVIGTVLGGALVRLVLPMTRALALQLSVPPWLVVLGVVVLTSLCLASALFAVLRGRSIRAVEVLK